MRVHLFWLIGILTLMAVAAVVLVAVVLAATKLQSPPLHAAAGPPPGTPLDILARRFAAGEITAEEYEKARDLLQGGNSKS